MTNNDPVLMFISFILIFTIIFAITLYKRNKKKSIYQDFDERQLIARSNAYKTSFLVMIMLILADSMLKIGGIQWYEEPFGELAIIFITLIVFACKSISSDAFFGRNDLQGKKNLLILYLAVGISNLAISLTNLNKLIENGKVTTRMISPLSGIVFLSIAIMMLVHDRRVKEEEEE